MKIHKKSIMENLNPENNLACKLTCKEFAERKTQLKKEVFDFVVNQKESEYGILFDFQEKEGFDKKLMDFIAVERTCCPFFDIKLHFQPYKKGISLEISGQKGVKDFLKAELLD